MMGHLHDVELIIIIVTTRRRREFFSFKLEENNHRLCARLLINRFPFVESRDDQSLSSDRRDRIIGIELHASLPTKSSLSRMKHVIERLFLHPRD